MNKLQEIKDNWAKEQGYDNWDNYYNDRYFGLSYTDEYALNEIARRYAKAVADDALKRAAERATVKQYQHDHGFEVDKQSILSTEINLDLAIEEGSEG